MGICLPDDWRLALLLAKITSMANGMEVDVKKKETSLIFDARDDKVPRR